IGQRVAHGHEGRRTRAAVPHVLRDPTDGILRTILHALNLAVEFLGVGSEQGRLLRFMIDYPPSPLSPGHQFCRCVLTQPPRAVVANLSRAALAGQTVMVAGAGVGDAVFQRVLERLRR
ncbi:hypothetical protein, partial [Nocardia sp. NPDC004260]